MSGCVGGMLQRAEGMGRSRQTCGVSVLYHFRRVQVRPQSTETWCLLQSPTGCGYRKDLSVTGHYPGPSLVDGPARKEGDRM